MHLSYGASRIGQGFRPHREVGCEHLVVFSTFAFFRAWVDGKQ